MTFSFIPGPSGRAMTDEDFITSSLDQPLSMGSTFWDNTKQGLNESFGIGTAIRSLTTPEAAPPTDGGLGDTIGAINRAISPDSIIRRVIGTDYDGQAALSEDQYKSSTSFRESIPFAPGMTEDRTASLAQADDLKKVREFYAEKRPITAFLGKLAGSAVDPINYIPIAGEAVAAANAARFGRVGGAALTSSIDAAANTAIFGIGTAQVRGQLGDEVGFQDTLTQVAMAALIGGAFGAVGGALGRARGSSPELRAEAETKLATLQRVQESRVALNDAIDGMLNRGEVEISPASADFVASAAERLPEPKATAEQLRAIRAKGETDYQFTANAVMTPDAYTNFRDVMADLPAPVNEQYQVHGMMASSDGSIAEQRLIDLIEKGLDPKRSLNSGNPRGGTLGVDSTRTEAAYLLMSDKGKTIPETGIKNVVVQGPAEANIAQLRQDYPAVNFMTPTEARAFIETGIPPVKSTPARPISAKPTRQRKAKPDTRTPRVENAPAVAEAAKRVGKPEADRAMAEQYRVNPETGEYPEIADIERLRSEGRLTEEDIAALEDADAILTTANSYGEALKAFAACEI